MVNPFVPEKLSQESVIDGGDVETAASTMTEFLLEGLCAQRAMDMTMARMKDTLRLSMRFALQVGSRVSVHFRFAEAPHGRRCVRQRGPKLGTDGHFIVGIRPRVTPGRRIPLSGRST